MFRRIRGLAVGDMTREPSMEDILSSIRKVIARDDAPTRTSVSISEAPVAVDSPAADEPDVLELSEESDDAAQVAIPAAELVAAGTADAARRSLEALSAVVHTPETTAAAPVASGGSRTLDDVVTEALRPLLKQWLDTNLPPLVEAMVAKEIARITGRRF
jgi:uncharacterized protein